MSFLSGAETSSNANFIRYKSQKDQWEIDNQKVDLKPFVIDPNKIKLGWLHISQGAYDAHWFANPHVPIPTPEGIDSDGKPLYKEAFSCELYNKELGLCEWSSNSYVARVGFDQLYQDILTGFVENKTKVPVIEYKGSEELTLKRGSSRKPTFNIMKWIDMPEAIADTSSIAVPPTEVKEQVIEVEF